jgi:hypothetical protein
MIKVNIRIYGKYIVFAFIWKKYVFYAAFSFHCSVISQATFISGWVLELCLRQTV